MLYLIAFTQKDFNYPLLDLPQRDFHRGVITYNLGVHNSNSLKNTITSTQEGGQSKERNTLGDHNDHKHSLADLKGSQTIFLTKQDSKNRFEMIAQVCEKIKCFEKETTKKTLGKKL